MTSTLVREQAVRPRHPSLILGTILVAQFMAVLDVSIANVSAPAIGADLDASGAGLQMVVSGYTVTYAVLLVGGARLGDRLGHARVFRAGLAAFTLMSLLCGLAPTTALLITARALQGAGAALMMPQVMSLIQRTFAGQARLRALSLYGAVIALGAVVGQVLGGVLVSADLFGTTWRPAFLINVPVGVVLLVVARRRLPSEPGDPSRRLDPAGTVLLAAAVLLLVLPLVLGHDLGWPAWCFVCLACCVVTLGVFAVIESRVERSGGLPIVSRRVLRAPGLLPAAGAILLNIATYSGFLFGLALFLQQVLGYGAARTGLLFAPTGVGFALTGLTWSRLPARWHGPMIPAGFVIGCGCYVAMAVAFGSGGSPDLVLALVGATLGLALGYAFSPLMGRGLAHVELRDAADASGVLVTTVQLGQVLGVAVFGTIYLQLAHDPRHAVAVTLTAIGASLLAAAALSVRAVRAVRVRSS